MRRVGVSVFAAMCAASVCGADVSPNWFRAPAISPDGQTIIFTHGGDLYSVSSDGGRAIPLTLHDAYDTNPVWSNDGRSIAFSSNRNGNFDVFIMPAAGGPARQLTYHSAGDTPTDFSPDDGRVIFESARLDSADCVLFPSGILSELYSVSVNGGTPTQLLTTPALHARYDRDGSRIIYEDRKGYEDDLRKHHTSSIARDIWWYDVRSGDHTKITDFPGEDRNPHIGPDGSTIFFLSERGGDSNVFSMPMADEARARQLTSFEDHPVRDLSMASDGTMAFSWHGDIYTLSAGDKPQRLDISINVDSDGRTARMTSIAGGVSDFSPSPNGKEIAFVARGEVFVTSTDFRTTRRITDTPEQERSVDFAPDGRSLIYAGERDGSWNVYETSIVEDDELYFFSSTKLEERELAATDAEEFQPAYAPDGKSIAYLHNRTVLRVMDLETLESRVVLPGDTFYSYSDGDHWFAWSPDSRWLAVHYYNRGRAWVTEVGIVPADGSNTTPIDLSMSGYGDVTPRWAMDGHALIWSTDRYGERMHGGFGAEGDVVGLFLTQDAHDRFTRSKEEYELAKELEEKQKESEEEDAAEDADEDTEAADDEDADAEEEPIEFELEGLETRLERLTIHASDLGDFFMTPDADKLYYLARFERGYDLWVHDFREESTKIHAKLNAGSASMELSAEGDTIFLLADGGLSKVGLSDGAQKPVSYAASMEIDPVAERAYLLDHVWRQTKQKFYRPDMHGVDWAFYLEQYEPKLAGITNSQDFAEILKEMLGELNASHTGGRYFRPRQDGDASTASLGVFYENNHAGPGMRIEEIMKGGPLDRADLDIVEGMIITAVDGVTVAGTQNYFQLLDGKAGDRVRLTLEGEDGSIERVVRPVSLGAENELRYQRWITTRRDLVESVSGGRLGYVHVRGMNDPSFRAFYSEVMGRHFDKEALIVDTPFNGGGWLHDQLATFLTGIPYVDLYPRNDEVPDLRYFGEPAERWTKPSIVVMSESNYSDAHFFPWVYTELEIGDTLGMPVPGTATAVWWERLHTNDLVFGIPQVGTKGADGRYLENNQLEPTHLVRLDPKDSATGTDTQIREAVRVLIEQLDD